MASKEDLMTNKNTQVEVCKPNPNKAHLKICCEKLTRTGMKYLGISVNPYDIMYYVTFNISASLENYNYRIQNYSLKCLN